jgi:Glyoxalase-like domain
MFSFQRVSKQRWNRRVLPGGTHVDGLTYNALVVLGDGVYVELIAFTHEISYYPPGTLARTRREQHRWADKLPGWIDMALLGLDQFVGEVINKRAGSTLYSPPADGGRTRPDGVELEWRVTFPERELGAGVLPFFCEDITPRDLRVSAHVPGSGAQEIVNQFFFHKVPSEPPGNTVHPSSAKGIAYVKLLSPTGLYASLVDQLNTVVGSKPLSSSRSETSWKISTLSGHPQHVTRLILSVRDGCGDVALPKSGLIEVGFWVDKRRGGPAGDGPLGQRVVWVELT